MSVYDQISDGTLRTNYEITDRIAANLQAASDRATANENAGYAGISGATQRLGDDSKGTSYIAPATTATPYTTTATADTAEQIRKAQADAEATRKAQTDALKTTYGDQLKATIRPYETAKAEIPGQVATFNNQASNNGMVNAQKIRNTLSQMGLLQSGESASQQLTNNVGTANSINANNLQGQQLETGYNDKIAMATAQNALELNNALFKVDQLSQTLGLSQAQFAAQLAQQGVDNAYRDKAFAQSANQFAQQLGMSQQQYASGLDQWAKTFAQQQAQDTFNNGINAGNLTGYAPKIISDLYPNMSNPNSTTKTSTATGLPPEVASSFPGATLISSNNGSYKFTNANGDLVYYSAG